MELISLVSSLASILLAVLAIWISFYHKKESDSVNQKTSDLLVEIKTDAKTISQFAMPELGKWNDTMRDFVSRQSNSDYDLLINNVSESINKELSVFRKEIDKFKSSNNLTEIEHKVEDIRKLASNTENKIKTEIKSLTDYIEIDSEEFGIESVRLKINSFNNFQALLNEIYLMFLRGKVNAWSYGKSWIIINHRNGEKLWQQKKEDRRALSEVGIKPNDKLLIVMMK